MRQPNDYSDVITAFAHAVDRVRGAVRRHSDPSRVDVERECSRLAAEIETTQATGDFARADRRALRAIERWERDVVGQLNGGGTDA
jgi:hypothetical protein